MLGLCLLRPCGSDRHYFDEGCATIISQAYVFLNPTGFRSRLIDVNEPERVKVDLDCVDVIIVDASRCPAAISLIQISL